MAAQESMIPVHGVILAGGSGSRMRQLTSGTPKALLPIRNKPMFHHPLEKLLTAGVKTITIITPETHEDAFRSTLATLDHPALPAANINFKPAPTGTADVLRDLSPVAQDVLVLAADYVGDVSIPCLLNFHVATNASLTAALTPTPKPDIPKSSKSKPIKKPAFPIDHYTLLSDTTLHAIIRPTDIQSSLTVPRALLAIPDIVLRSDLFDPHVYAIHLPTVNPILEKYSTISSIRFDLLPYLSRRQGALSKRSDGEPVNVQAYVTDARAARANTVQEFLKVNLERPEERATKGKDKGKGKGKGAKLPFEEVGERVNVSESLVAGGKAGDKVSIKKSVVGVATFESGVKVNGCVIMDDVVVKENANMSGCILCKGATVEEGVTLKDCRVAEGVTVSADGEGKDFVAKEDGWGDDIEFC